MENLFKPTWKKVIVSLISALVLGLAAGIYLFYSGSCFSIIWGEVSNCASYSSTKMFFSYLFSWPIFTISKFVTGSPVNFDRIIVKDFGWLAIWVYYYLIVCIIEYFINRKKI